MKIIAAIIMGVMLPLSFATPAQASHLSAEITNYYCTPKGNTRYEFTVNNRTSKSRHFNWIITKPGVTTAQGSYPVRKRNKVYVLVLDGSTADVKLFSRRNQKTRILHTKLSAVKCFD